MKQIWKRWLAAALCLCLLTALAPQAHAAGKQGSFYFTIMTANRVVLEPEAVPYTAGQTVEEAIVAAGHELEKIEDGSIVAIDGVEAMYLRYYDNGGYDLDKSAEEITAMMFCVNDVYSPAMIELIAAMGRFHTTETNLRNDPASKAAYESALDELCTANADTARTLCDTLTAAMQAYEDRMNGPKYTISFQVTQGGTAVAKPAVTLTDDCGNVTTGKGSASVVAGNYTYVITDGGYNRTEGKITVSQNETITAQLPSGQWFGTVEARDGNHNKDAFASTQSGNHVTWYIDDTASTSSVYLYAEQGAVPTKATRLYAIYTDLDGNDCSEAYRSWQSLSTKLAGLLDKGMTGRSFTLEAHDTSTGATMIQTMEVEVIRVPTLKTLTVTQNDTPLYLPFDSTKTTYALRATASQVTIDAQAYTIEGTTVTINGKQKATVSLSVGKNTVPVQVQHENGQSRTYQLQIEKVNDAAVTLSVPSGMTAEIRNQGGAVIAQKNGVYQLIPGDTYTCVSTRDTWYHAALTFVAADGQKLTAPVPETTDALQGIALYNKSAWTSRTALALNDTFRAACHSYSVTALDTLASVYAQATPLNEAEQTVWAQYTAQSTTEEKHGVETAVKLEYAVSDMGKCSFLTNCLARSGYSQQVTLRVERAASETLTQYQEYDITIQRQLQLASLSGTANGEALDLLDENGNVCRFTADRHEYTMQVLESIEAVQLSAAFSNELTDTAACGGYYAIVAGQRQENLSALTIRPNWTDGQQDVTIEVHHEDSNTKPTVYTLHLKKVVPVQVRFNVMPEDAVAFVLSNKTDKPVYAQNGVYTMIPGNEYTYYVTCSGYVAKTVSNYKAPAEDTTITVTLQQAPANTTLEELTAAWPGFRPTEDNNCIIDAPMPTTAEDTVLYWANQVGNGWYGEACGCPILVDDMIYVYAGTNLYKLDKTTGEILATGQMDHSSSWCINSATYGGGMIFVGLSDGSVQAFNAVTLESVWIYRDRLGGQPNCPIIYHDGFVYTGFWRSEKLDGNFVCLSTTDEDPTQPKEEKAASWIYTIGGGFYWSGACVTDDYVLVGSDDGENGNGTGHASLLCLDRRTGDVRSSIQLPHSGDVRCNITYDTQSGKYYFVTKGGYFYCVDVKEGGLIDEASLKSLKLQNGTDTTAGSGCTPTIYNGRAYVGVGGSGAYAPYTGHNITVIDLNNWEIAYRVDTQGNPQTSGILTTAYDEGDGSVYVYFVENYTPGTIRVIRDKPGQTRPAQTVTEVYKGKSYQVAPALFTPFGDHTEYCICSPVVDSDGTIYFKNDSGYLMALGSVPTALEITQTADKLTYEAGETFDATGLQVYATYGNGTRRDVTGALQWNTDALTTDDEQFELTLPVGYQNRDGQAGQEVESLTVTLTLQVTPQQTPDPTPVELPFTDLPNGAWYLDSVRYVYENGLMSGTTSTTFGPDEVLTRGMFVAMLYRMEGSPAVEGTCSFSDVIPGFYYEKAIIWANENGIVYGSDGKFEPDGKITREAMAAMMRRYAAFCQIDTSDRISLNGYVDAAQVSSWFKEDMQWAVAVNMLYGDDKGNLLPQSNATRAEAAAVLQRFAENILK